METETENIYSIRHKKNVKIICDFNKGVVSLIQEKTKKQKLS